MYTQAIILAAVVTGIFIVVHFFSGFIKRGPGKPRRPRWNPWEWLIYLTFVVSSGVLVFTSFVSIWRHGAMHGWNLWIHLGAAGAFTVSLALIAITWAGAAISTFEAISKPAGEVPERFSVLTAGSFWLAIISGTISLATMLASMVPLLGTSQIELMIEIHRYSGLVLAAAVVLHLYSISLGRLGRQ